MTSQRSSRAGDDVGCFFLGGESPHLQRRQWVTPVADAPSQSMNDDELNDLVALSDCVVNVDSVEGFKNV